MRALIGIDVGATTISGGLVTPSGEVLFATQTPTHVKGPGTAVRDLVDLLHELVSEAKIRRLTLQGVGIGLPGPVDADKGIMVGSDNLVPEFSHLPLAEHIGSTFGVPVFVDNDANTLALAELTFGIGRGADSLVVLAIGTGVGGGIVLNGALVRGRGGYGGELGHVPVKFDGPPCRNGVHGCLCAYISGDVIERRAREQVALHPDSAILSPASGDRRAITSQQVFLAAAAGDQLAHAIVDEACEALSAVLGGIVNGLNPEVIVVTGGVVASLTSLQADVLRRTAKYALAPALANTSVHFVPADKRDTVRGGAALVLYEFARRERIRL